MRISLPLYWYPSGGSWGAAALKAHTVLQGTDGSSKDATKVAAVKQAQEAGCRVLGYVSTDYGATPAATCEQHIRNYRNWYGLTGIFFDEMSTLASDIPYYGSLGDYARLIIPGCDTFANPGAMPAMEYLDCFDTLQICEGSYSADLTTPPWVKSNYNYRFAYTFHDTPATDLDAAFALAEANNVGYIYVTDGTEASGNPYSSVPSYWTEETALV
jgi:hypothetical protein